jgi:hypothetical protein
MLTILLASARLASNPARFLSANALANDWRWFSGINRNDWLMSSSIRFDWLIAFYIVIVVILRLNHSG